MPPTPTPPAGPSQSPPDPPPPGRQWCVLRTRARAEKAVADWCERLDLPAFLPLQRREKRYQRRRVVSYKPLFPGYVFACLPVGDTAALSQHRLVASVLVPPPELAAQLLRELRDIHALLHSGLAGAISVQPRLEPGQLVEITAGPLAGMTGIVVRSPRGARISVNVAMIGQSVTVELDSDEAVPC